MVSLRQLTTTLRVSKLLNSVSREICSTTCLHKGLRRANEKLYDMTINNRVRNLIYDMPLRTGLQCYEKVYDAYGRFRRMTNYYHAMLRAYKSVESLVYEVLRKFYEMINEIVPKDFRGMTTYLHVIIPTRC